MKAIIDTKKKKIIETAIDQNIPLLLIGETGTGKTTIVQAIAKLRGQDLVRVSINGNTSTEEILGKFILKKGETVWVDGVITDAMRKGYWVVMDEINSAAPDILFALHGILDHEKAIVLPEKDNERVVAHDDFRFVATMNPDSYVGTKNLNAAFMSRFIVEYIEYLDPEKEKKLLVDKTGLDEQVAKNLVAIATELRKLKTEEKVEFSCSTRDLEYAANLIKNGIDFEYAVNSAIFNKMNSLELEDIRSDYKGLSQILKSGTSTIDKIEAKIKELDDKLIRVESREKRMVELEIAIPKLEEEYKTLVEKKAKFEKEFGSDIFVKFNPSTGAAVAAGGTSIPEEGKLGQIGELVKLRDYIGFADYESHNGEIAVIKDYKEGGSERPWSVLWADGTVSQVSTSNLVVATEGEPNPPSA